ncbi:uncharacterized protein LOC133825200 [Humulus lupulus]|uniref:uncharacterized protein LOC133825200 n=1 Tax=Humulus lupulus TaxID=3486 RepID=UPI002B410C4B|nr:uncharacterized protein LOC133825200 [Humulus lupulus]
MGRVKYTARRKKRTANPPSNQLAPHTKEPSTNPQPVNTVPPEIQTKARPRNDLSQRSNDVREPTAGSDTGGDIPEQHQDVSQPPRRQAIGVTIKEPSNIPRAAAVPTQHGKGKQKLPEYPQPILESFDENVMTSEEAFDLYRKPKGKTFASRRKESRRHPGESSSVPSKKRAKTEDPPTPVPSRETTPPPAPVNPTPSAPVDLTPPASVNPTPPDQSGKAQAKAVLNTAYNSANDKLKKLSKHRYSQEAFRNVSSMKVEQSLSRSLNERLSGVLTLSTSWPCSEETSAKHAKEIKVVEGRLAEQVKAADGEELKQHKEALAKVTEAKERYKDSSVLNFKEASKLQDELAIRRKETAELEERVKLLEETNASDLERMKQAELAKCVARLEEEETAQGSPEISLATGIEGMDEGADTTIDQQPQQDPPSAAAAS